MRREELLEYVVRLRREAVEQRLARRRRARKLLEDDGVDFLLLERHLQRAHAVGLVLRHDLREETLHLRELGFERFDLFRVFRLHGRSVRSSLPRGCRLLLRRVRLDDVRVRIPLLREGLDERIEALLCRPLLLGRLARGLEGAFPGILCLRGGLCLTVLPQRLTRLRRRHGRHALLARGRDDVDALPAA